MKSWTYKPTSNLLTEIPFPQSSFCTDFDLLNRGVFFIWQIMLRLFLKFYYQVEIKGQENLPSDGSYILISNHCSHLDTMCLLSVVPLSRINETYAAAAEDYFFVNRWKAAVVNSLFHAVPFSRIKTRETHQSLVQCKTLLSLKERTLIYFPEGQRSLNGSLQPFKRGIGFLLASTRFKVIPVYVQGAYQAWPKGKRLPRPGKLKLQIGKPMKFSNVHRNSNSYAIIAQMIERKLKALSQSTNLYGAYCEKST